MTDNQTVTVTAVSLALTAFVWVSLDTTPLPVSGDFGAEFLLSLSLMDMAFTYNDYWAVAYRPMYAVLWTFLFGVVTTVVFISVYVFGLRTVGQTTAALAAFLIAVSLQFGSAVLYARVR